MQHDCFSCDEQEKGSRQRKWAQGSRCLAAEEKGREDDLKERKWVK